VRQAERDSGHRRGLTTDERQRMKDLEREVRELTTPPPRETCCSSSAEEAIFRRTVRFTESLSFGDCLEPVENLRSLSADSRQ
jgi:hypothetical protein